MSAVDLPPATHQPHLLIPSAQTINQEKAQNSEMRSKSQQILLYCLRLHTKNPGIRKVDLEHSLKRGSYEIKHAETRKKHPKESKSHCVVWTHI